MKGQAERFAQLAVKATGRGPWSHEEVMAEMDMPICRWCRGAVIRGLPCHCDRAQEEARRIRADQR